MFTSTTTKGVGNSMMISSNHRQQLSAWFLTKNNSQFFSQLKLQKFLFLYEMFSKIEKGTGDFSSLKAYKNGPVYSDVYGDFTYRQENFIAVLQNLDARNDVEEYLADYSNFIVSILNEEELSDLTHELNMWKVHRGNIHRGKLHIPMYETDIDLSDHNFVKELFHMYQDINLNEVEVLTINQTNFVLEKSLNKQLTEEQREALFTIADQELNNPVFVSIGEDGVLEID